MKQHYSLNWLIERYEFGAQLEYIFFWGHRLNSGTPDVTKQCFSQWFELPFTVDGIIYKTAEHWMMAQKALLFGDLAVYEKVLNADKPNEVKQLGRQISYFNEAVWNEHKYEIVKLGNIHKFNQNPAYGDYLLQTGDKILVEASPVDTVWGIGLAQDNDDIHNLYLWRGENLLGFALMEVRDLLSTFGFFETPELTMPLLWKIYPDIDTADMFWRMGKGEDLLMQFGNYYHSLSEKEQMIFKLSHPVPYHWKNFYN